MAFSRTIPIALGAGKAGLTLNAQLVDTAGADVGLPIATGFSEHGDNGVYLWRHTAFTDGFEGGVKIINSADSEILGITEVDPTLDSFRDDYTTARAGYLDNLNIGGLVASSAEATAIQNNTRVVRVVPAVIERPDSGTTTYRVELLLYDDVGNMEVPDSAPTIALVNQSGTDRSSRLDSTTMALVSTGRYRAIYTADAADTIEQLVWTFSVVEGGATRIYGNDSLIVDTTAVDFTAADRTKLDTLHDTRLTAGRASNLDNLDATISSRESESSASTRATADQTEHDATQSAIATLITAIDDLEAHGDITWALTARQSQALQFLRNRRIESVLTATTGKVVVRNDGDTADAYELPTVLTPMRDPVVEVGHS